MKILIADDHALFRESLRTLLEAHGQETRTVTTTYDKPVRLRRSAARCPACGRRLFPPG